MLVTANGRQVELPPGSTLGDLLVVLGLGRTWVLVERNGAPVERAAVASTALGEGDRLELVRAVAGGAG